MSAEQSLDVYRDLKMRVFDKYHAEDKETSILEGEEIQLNE
jgi:hypothetical protein